MLATGPCPCRYRCMHSRAFAPFSFLLTLVFAGCAAESGDTEATEITGASAARAVHDDCIGDVECSGSSASQRARRYRQGETCVVAGLALERGGSVGDSPSARWTGDSSAVTICVAEHCLTCTPVTGAGASGAGPRTPSCKGEPSACSSGSPGSCASVYGCRMNSRVRYDGTFEHTCGGTARGCATMGSARDCRSQGCRWN